MQWISVKDKLPKDFKDQGKCHYDYVLVFSEAKNNCFLPMFAIAQYRDDHWEFMDDNKSGAHCCTGTYECESEWISHWCWLEYPDKEKDIEREPNDEEKKYFNKKYGTKL